MPVVHPDRTVQGQVNKSADLTAKKAGDLAAATVHLFSNDYVPVPESILTDFTEPGYGGYASVAVAGWGANEVNADGSVSTDATNVASFTGPAAGGGPTVYGYFVRSAGAGTPYLYAARFDTPQALADDTQTLGVVATYVAP